MGDIDLHRFLEAQENSYSQALAELRRGAKRGHWIWFIFPQLAGLGRSETSRYYGITGLAEAKAYADHPVLGERLRASTLAVLAHEDKTAEDVFGGLDAMKLRSSMTLFDAAAEAAGPFRQVLDQFFDGAPDEATLKMLGHAPD